MQGWKISLKIFKKLQKLLESTFLGFCWVVIFGLNTLEL